MRDSRDIRRKRMDRIAGWMALATREMDAAIPNRNMVNHKVVKNHELHERAFPIIKILAEVGFAGISALVPYVLHG